MRFAVEKFEQLQTKFSYFTFSEEQQELLQATAPKEQEPSTSEKQQRYCRSCNKPMKGHPRGRCNNEW